MKKYILICVLLIILAIGAGGFLYKPQNEGMARSSTMHMVENNAPDAESIKAIPYSYRGEGKYFSVQCDVRTLTHSERQENIMLKKDMINQLFALQKQEPLREEYYRLIIDKIKRDIEIFENEDLYITHITGRLKDQTINLKDKDIISFSIERKGKTYLSSSALLNSKFWASIINSSDGSYSQGAFLPNKDDYNIKVIYGNIEDSFIISK